MREELIRVLNYKLNDINSDIEALENLYNKIDEEKEKSDFIEGILNTFKKEDGNDVMNLVKVSKEDFNRSLELAGDDIQETFNSGSCNYDGLVYLINGINSGVSLTLTDEQISGVKRLISALVDSKKEIDSAIDGYILVKSRYEINDIGVLEKQKSEYQALIDGINKNDYIKDTKLLTDAIKFSSLSSEDTVDLLTYVLEYNADVYKENKNTFAETSNEKYEEDKAETNEPVEQNEIEVEENEEEKVDDFHFNQIDDSNLFELPNITFDDEKENENNEEVEQENDELKEDSENYIPEYQEYTPYNDEEETSIPSDLTYVPKVDENTEEIIPDDVHYEEEVNIPEENSEENSFDEETKLSEDNVENSVVEEPVSFDNDFSDVIDVKEDYDDHETQEEERTSTRELQKIFGKYGIEENTILNELVDGNVNEYQNIFDSLKDNGILEFFRINKELLIETLLYSNVDVVDNVLKIVKNDLSVDDEDYNITLKIVINTIPSIFVKEGGNYDNFVKNIQLFKDNDINLINLFDFSKEVFIADHENIKKNLDVINKYGFDINYKNAKYFLLIPNIADKLDYYIESVYLDKEKGATFDGIDYIKDYAAKLNVVTDETIKRLRYASENGKKVFGSKSGSLSGEITNLKVNALDISDEYLNKFFNNEFANLTGDEVREYVKLIHNSSNVGDYSDELDKLNKYRNGLRYNIDGVNVSYNKVVRNYSILRSYGMDSKKALQFAVCYNLVITKEEYDRLNSLLEEIGGNV